LGRAILHLLPPLNSYANPQISDAKGGDKAKTLFKASIISTDKYHTVALVVDADDNAAGKYQFVRDTLQKAGYADVPTNQPLSGLYLPAPNEGLAAVARWIMPNNTDKGALGLFLQPCIENKDADLLKHAKTAVETLPLAQPRFKPVHTPKAALHTWLAWQESPNAGIFEGIEKEYFDMSVPVAQVFTKWLRLVLGEG